MNVRKMFRRRPGRLLSVLCTFNLRPMSAGNIISFKIKLKLKSSIYFLFQKLKTINKFYEIIAKGNSKYSFKKKQILNLHARFFFLLLMVQL